MHALFGMCCDRVMFILLLVAMSTKEKDEMMQRSDNRKQVRSIGDGKQREEECKCIFIVSFAAVHTKPVRLSATFEQGNKVKDNN